jgi:FixJ family two-component response regulator
MNETPEPALIAIVDDDKSICTATEDLFRAAGFRAAGFGDAESFLASPLRASVACVVADMRMPGMSGIEMHRRMVRSGQGIPTVIITAQLQELARLRERDAGITCYLTKPFTPDELLDCVQRALARPQLGGYP